MGGSLARPVVFAVPPQNFIETAAAPVTTPDGGQRPVSVCGLHRGRRGRQASMIKKFFEAVPAKQTKGNCCWMDDGVEDLSLPANRLRHSRKPTLRPTAPRLSAWIGGHPPRCTDPARRSLLPILSLPYLFSH